MKFTNDTAAADQPARDQQLEQHQQHDDMSATKAISEVDPDIIVDGARNLRLDSPEPAGGNDTPPRPPHAHTDRHRSHGRRHHGPPPPGAPGIMGPPFMGPGLMGPPPLFCGHLGDAIPPPPGFAFAFDPSFGGQGPPHGGRGHHGRRHSNAKGKHSGVDDFGAQPEREHSHKHKGRHHRAYSPPSWDGFKAEAARGPREHREHVGGPGGHHHGRHGHHGGHPSHRHPRHGRHHSKPPPPAVEGTEIPSTTEKKPFPITDSDSTSDSSTSDSFSESESDSGSESDSSVTPSDVEAFYKVLRARSRHYGGGSRRGGMGMGGRGGHRHGPRGQFGEMGRYMGGMGMGMGHFGMGGPGGRPVGPAPPQPPPHMRFNHLYLSTFTPPPPPPPHPRHFTDLNNEPRHGPAAFGFSSFGPLDGYGLPGGPAGHRHEHRRRHRGPPPPEPFSEEDYASPEDFNMHARAHAHAHAHTQPRTGPSHQDLQRPLGFGRRGPPPPPPGPELPGMLGGFDGYGGHGRRDHGHGHGPRRKHAEREDRRSLPPF